MRRLPSDLSVFFLSSYGSTRLTTHKKGFASHPSQHSSAAFADLPRFGNLSTITCAALRETDLCWCDSVAQGSSDPNGPGHSAGCIRPSKTEVWSQMLLISCEPHRIIETWHFYQWMFRIKTEELFSTKDRFGLRIKFGTKDLIYNGHAERSILRSTETVASFESTTLYCEQARAIGIFSPGNSIMTFSGLCWPLWQTIDLQVGSKKVTFELPVALYLIVDLLISCLRLLPSYWKTPQDNMVVGSFGGKAGDLAVVLCVSTCPSCPVQHHSHIQQLAHPLSAKLWRSNAIPNSDHQLVKGSCDLSNHWKSPI